MFYAKQSSTHCFNKFTFRRSLCLYGKSNSIALDVTPLQSQPWRLNRVIRSQHKHEMSYNQRNNTPWDNQNIQAPMPATCFMVCTQSVITQCAFGSVRHSTLHLPCQRHSGPRPFLDKYMLYDPSCSTFWRKLCMRLQKCEPT